MIYSIIDIGSNSVRMSVYRINNDNSFTRLFSEKEMAGLINYIVDNNMTEEGIDKICEILDDFLSILSRLGMEDSIILGTAALRNIDNREYTVNQVYERTGAKINVLSGDEEGRIGYLGVCNETNLDNGLMVDIGGGSVEFVRIADGDVCGSDSYPLGSLSLFKNNVAKIWPTKKEIIAMENDVDKLLSDPGLSDMHTDQICFIGGSARAVLKICNHMYKKPSNNQNITTKELKEIVSLLKSKSTEARSLVLKACPDRVHTIIPGTIFINKIVQNTKAKDIFIGKYGLREGYLCQKMKK